MLEIVENYLQALTGARSDADVTRVLADVAKAFGFRSAYVIEYAGKLSAVQHVVDTDPARKAWWSEFFASDLRPTPRNVEDMLTQSTLLRLTSARLSNEPTKLRIALETNDVVDVVAVPISREGELVGVAGFCGTPKLDRRQEMALQLIAYTAFARFRTERPHDTPRSNIELTPREKEVMRLSSDGLTSAEIAKRLGISARTANQHVDNVADKLGTRNRAHTVAEIVRRGLL
jgi:LuxR family transcriptional regulator, quorum-sensing system regulator BjaR1